MRLFTDDLRYGSAEPPKYTCKARFSYGSTRTAASGMLQLLVALKASKVKLTELDGYDGGGIFTDRGTFTFTVEGTSDEVEKFRAIWNS